MFSLSLMSPLFFTCPALLHPQDFAKYIVDYISYDSFSSYQEKMIPFHMFFSHIYFQTVREF